MTREQKIEMVAGLNGLSVSFVKLLTDGDDSKLSDMVEDVMQRFNFQSTNATASWF